jgi:hypothetical protein
MASSWMTSLVASSTAQQPSGTVTPSVKPTQPIQTVSKPPISTPGQTPTDQWATPQGKLFSGNLIQKAFDIPMLPQYAISGFQKSAYDEKAKQIQSGAVDTQSYGKNILNRAVAGIKGIIPGIKNRTMPGNEEGNVNVGKELGIKSNTGQAAYNLALSVAEPSLAIGKGVGLVKKIPWVTKAVGKVGNVVNKGVDVLRANEKIAKTIEHIPGQEFFRLPQLKKIFQGANENTQTRVSALFNQINDAAKGLKPYELEEVGSIIEGTQKTVTNANRKLFQRAEYIKNISDKVGQELVDLGVMSKDTFAKYKGGYLSHIADVVKNETASNMGSKALQFATSSLKKRRGKLGTELYPDYIRQFQFPTFKSLGGEITTAESARAIKNVVGEVGKTGEKFVKSIGGPRTTEAGMVAVSDLVPNQIKHVFKGMSVPQAAADYIAKTYAKVNPSLLDRIGSKALGYWKMGKTILNPAYHIRNQLSNIILSDMSTGAGLARTVLDYGEAVKAYTGKGSPRMMAYIQELKDAGVIGHTAFSQGVKEMNPKTFTKGKSLVGKIASAPFNFQNASEETSKLNVFSYWRDHGDDIKIAAQKAQEAIFSPYKISQAERGLTRNVIPFYSFARQALPFTAKTLVNNPERLTKYQKFKTGVESLSPEDTGQNKNLPESMQGGVRLPVKDKYGNNVYADPTYIYPFGNFTDAGMSKGQLPFGFGWNPAITEAASQAYNKDLYFDQPIAKSNIPEKAMGQRVSHAARTFAPTIFSTAGQIKSAFSGMPDYAGRSRNKVQAVLNALGLKSATFDPQNQTKWDSIDKNAKLKSIDSEIRNILKNQSIPQAEKTSSVKRLQEIKREVLQGK